MNETKEHFGLLTPDACTHGLMQRAWQSLGAPEKRHVEWLRSTESMKRWKGDGVFVFLSLHQAKQTREAVHRCPSRVRAGVRYIAFVTDPNPAAIADQVLRLGLRSPDRLIVAPDRPTRGFAKWSELLLRFMRTIRPDDDDDRVFAAWWEDDDFVVKSPQFRTLRVPLEALQKVRKASAEDWKTLELDPLGSYVYWPRMDVHMGWEELEQTVDPEAALRARQKGDAFNARYGKAIAEFREEKEIARSAVEGLSERNLRRIEQGEIRATSNALGALAAAHKMTLNEYLGVLAKRM